ncbi:ester cyclase [Nocardia sp. NPDC051750]|uniref:ester cyclase n=1 Tax=Nocardia sp. NPDC051750 TaxID=3364325 RepID=UPI0037885939
MSSTPEHNKSIFRRFHDVVNTGDLESISRTIAELTVPDMRLHTPLTTPETGRDAVEQTWVNLLRVFPDIQVRLEDVIAEGDKVAGRSVVTGTHRAEFMGIAPTGKRVEYNEMFIFRFTEGRVAEMWGVVDIFSLIRQLGGFPV